MTQSIGIEEARTVSLYYLKNFVGYSYSDSDSSTICDAVEGYSSFLFERDIRNDWRGERPFWLSQETNEKEDAEKEQLPPRSVSTIAEWLNGKEYAKPESAVVDMMMEAFHLNPRYKDLLVFWYWLLEIPLLTDLLCLENSQTSSVFQAHALGVQLSDFERIFSLDDELEEKGICQITYGNNIRPSGAFTAIVRNQFTTIEEMKSWFLGKKIEPELTPEDFANQPSYSVIRELLAKGFEKKTPGINILIYGAPGTGKTEMAKTICGDLGVNLYSPSSSKEEQPPHQRRLELSQSLNLTAAGEPTVLLVDEAGDLLGLADNGFDLDSHSYKSKLFFHRLLEGNQVPVIWICNSIDGFDPAHLRRFAYVTCMESMNADTQKKIWKKTAARYGIQLDESETDRLICDYGAVPALIDRALHNAEITDDFSMVEKTLRSLSGITSKPESHDTASDNAGTFSTDLLNCDEDLKRITERIAAGKTRKFSILLYGESGSGKSAYAEYLAQQLGMPIIRKRASDLIRSRVGETEMGIAAAFAEARRKRSILLFDEADSFLRDRRLAKYNWEITQVNELLTQMEAHPLPVICTTNLKNDMDFASMRRFDFKIRYRFLKKSQVEKAFRHFFGQEMPKGESTDMTCLTPGDFAVVAHKAKIMDTSDPFELAKNLRKEQASKEEEQNGKQMGFIL